MWAPLEARQAQTAHVFALSGYPAPCTKVWARLFAAWEQIQQYSMQDLQSAVDKADGKAPGPNHMEAHFIKALPAPVQ